MNFSRTFAAVGILFAASSNAFAAENSGSGFNWSGFYVGTYWAYGEGTSKSAVAVDAHPTGQFLGIHGGYLFDLDHVVLGLEGDASLADLDDDIIDGGAHLTQDFDNIAAVRARVGVPIDNALLSVSAGWSWADTEYGYLVEQEKKVISGPTVGIGAQYAFSNHLVGRLDYNHYFYGTTTYDLETQVDVKNSLDEIRAGVDFIFH